MSEFEEKSSVLEDKRELAYRLGSQKRSPEEFNKQLTSHGLPPAVHRSSENSEDPFEDIEAFLLEARREMNEAATAQHNDDGDDSNSSFTEVLLRQRMDEENQKMGKGRGVATTNPGKGVGRRLSAKALGVGRRDSGKGIGKERYAVGDITSDRSWSDHLRSSNGAFTEQEPSSGKKKNRVVSAGAYRMGGPQIEEELDSMMFQMPTLTAVKVEDEDLSKREATQRVRDEIMQNTVQAIGVKIEGESDEKSRRSRYIIIFLIFVVVIIVVSLVVIFTTNKTWKGTENIANAPTSIKYGNTWVKLGERLIGDVGNQDFGESVDFNSDATILAVGSSGKDDSTGRAEVRSYSATTGWYQVGNKLEGHFPGENFGHAVQLSADGRILAVSGFGSDRFGPEADYYGYVYGYKYDYDFQQWIQIGEGVQGDYKGDRFGVALSMANDGKSWIAGADNYFKGGKRDGYSKVYEWRNGQNWIQKGSTLRGTNGSRHGYSVAMSGDGQTICVGERDFMVEDAKVGRVRCFKWSNNDWEPKGKEILGIRHNEFFGYSVALNDNGTRIVASARWGGPNKEGTVTVYEFKNNDWEMLGNKMIGDKEEDGLGFKVVMNGPGNVVAFTGRGFDHAGRENTGVCKVMRFVDGAWQPLGNILPGYSEGDYFGESVALNSAGTAVAASANWNKVEYVSAFALIGDQDLL